MGLYLERPPALPKVPEFPSGQYFELKGPQRLVLGLKIPINQATASDLQALPGVGPVLAKKIVQYREGQGSYRSIGDLRQVSGIGELTLKNIAPYLSVEGPASK